MALRHDLRVVGASDLREVGSARCAGHEDVRVKLHIVAEDEHEARRAEAKNGGSVHGAKLFQFLRSKRCLPQVATGSTHALGTDGGSHGGGRHSLLRYHSLSLCPRSAQGQVVAGGGERSDVSEGGESAAGDQGAHSEAAEQPQTNRRHRLADGEGPA